MSLQHAINAYNHLGLWRAHDYNTCTAEGPFFLIDYTIDWVGRPTKFLSQHDTKEEAIAALVTLIVEAMSLDD
jgi:hypothetical protein